MPDSIDKSTGLPNGMPNRTPLTDRIRASAESAQLILQSSIPLPAIEKILILPANAKQLAWGESVEIPINRIPNFDLVAFEILAIQSGYDRIEKQASLIKSSIQPWAEQNGLTYSSTDTHTLSSLFMKFKMTAAEKV